MAEVETAKRYRPPRDTNTLIVLLAMIAGIVVVVTTSIAVWSFVHVLRQQHDLKVQAARQLVSRKATSDEICKKLNDTVRAAGANVDALNKLILDSVRQSKSFESVYVRLGLPSYAERLKEAEKQTRLLASKKPKGIDCERLADTIAAAGRSAPR